MDHVSTPIAPFYRSRRFSCVCAQPFRHRARRSRRRGHSVRPTASSYREAPPDPFTARAALIGSRRELHPLPDGIGWGHAVGLLPGVTAGFLTRRHENQPMKPNLSPTCAYGRALSAFVLNHGWGTASCHRANLGLWGRSQVIALRRLAKCGAGACQWCV
jgi:hypothetical protein